MMVAMISAMTATFIMTAPAPVISAFGNKETSTRDEQGGDSQHKE